MNNFWILFSLASKIGIFIVQHYNQPVSSKHGDQYLWLLYVSLLGIIIFIKITKLLIISPNYAPKGTHLPKIWPIIGT